MRNREQVIQIELCRYVSLKYPKVLFSSDMSGVRLSKKQAVQASKMRKRRGFPDFMIYEPIRARDNHDNMIYDFVGLAIEIKSESATVFKKDGSIRKDNHLEEQARWLQDLRERGWCAKFCVGLDEAMKTVDTYLSAYLY